MKTTKDVKVCTMLLGDARRYFRYHRVLFRSRYIMGCSHKSNIWSTSVRMNSVLCTLIHPTSSEICLFLFRNEIKCLYGAFIKTLFSFQREWTLKSQGSEVKALCVSDVFCTNERVSDCVQWNRSLFLSVVLCFIVFLLSLSVSMINLKCNLKSQSSDRCTLFPSVQYKNKYLL